MRTYRLTLNLILVCLALLLMVLATPLAGWAAAEASASEEGKAASQKAAPEEGRGEGFQPEPPGEECPATFGPIITDTAIPIDKGKFAVQPTFGVGFVTRTFSPNWRRVSAGGNFYSFSMDYKFTYGLWDNLEVFVVVPYLLNWANGVNTPGPEGERSASFGGINDVNLTFKYRLVEETETRPTVTALFATDFPTGHFRHLNPGRLGTDEIGGGAYAFTTGLNLSKYVRPFVFYGNFWYSMQTDFTNDDGRQHPRDFVTVNLAAEYPIVPKWVALLELTSSWDGGRLFGAKSNVAPAALLSILPGLEYMATDKFSVALGVNVDLIGKNNNAVVTPLLSMVYAF
ncbi:MAG: transporter [Thermodesulfobacteriota bacterium]